MVNPTTRLKRRSLKAAVRHMAMSRRIAAKARKMIANRKAKDGKSTEMKRISSGRYEYGHYAVERIGTDWRWYDLLRPNTGGEWRRTKRETAVDLKDFLGTLVNP